MPEYIADQAQSPLAPGRYAYPAGPDERARLPLHQGLQSQMDAEEYKRRNWEQDRKANAPEALMLQADELAKVDTRLRLTYQPPGIMAAGWGLDGRAVFDWPALAQMAKEQFGNGALASLLIAAHQAGRDEAADARTPKNDRV